MREAFYCPAAGCGVYAKQEWDQLYFQSTPGFKILGEHLVAHCTACWEPSIWREDVMIYPLRRQGEDPHSDMPADVLAVYEEARSVAPVSKKSAAGLLRLALQMLVDELEPGSGTIDSKIGALVKRGLDPQLQQAMDVLRVVGNESVHPGQIDLDADDDLLPGLFNLANVIVEQVVARPKHIGGLFAKLPQTKLDAIQKRDGNP
jgi:hypothetical protein